jgi:hypothetical protein
MPQKLSKKAKKFIEEHIKGNKSVPFELIDLDNEEEAERARNLAIKYNKLAEPAVKDCPLESLFLWRNSDTKEVYLDSTDLFVERKPRVCVICGREFEGSCKFVTCPNCRNRRRPRNIVEIRRI